MWDGKILNVRWWGPCVFGKVWARCLMECSLFEKV